MNFYQHLTAWYNIHLTTLDFGLFTVQVDSGKIIGLFGMLLFTGRWVVQVIASRRHRRPVVPRLFWYMSLSGSVLLLSYFVFGKNDSIGILSNLFPMVIALYNLYLDITHHRTLLPSTTEK
ncbi:MAG: lipid-A-disaccharide synthase N-terminal domain-containing protein [Candidatus Methylacidiphilales bacterium]